MMSYIRVTFRKVTKKRNLACEHDVIYKGLNLEKLLKKEI